MNVKAPRLERVPTGTRACTRGEAGRVGSFGLEWPSLVNRCQTFPKKGGDQMRLEKEIRGEGGEEHDSRTEVQRGEIFNQRILPFTRRRVTRRWAANNDGEGDRSDGTP